MPGQQAWIAKGVPSTASTPVDIMERASPDVFTTITADPGSAGTVLDVALRDRLPQAAPFKVRVDNEVMLVTAGVGTGPGAFTVGRGQDGTIAVAHTTGVTCSLVVGIQRVDPVDASRQVSFKGRVGTFRTPGRAGTTGQKLFAIHNATGSAVNVDVHNMQVDVVQTVVKPVTVLPPVIRVYKFTAVPANGTALTKNGEDAALTSKSTVTVWGDASADGTVSGVALAIGAITVGTQAGLMDQVFAPRYMLPAGTATTAPNPVVELIDVVKYFEGEDEILTLRPLEGIAVFLDYTLATQNPTTDMWVCSARWVEYAPA